MRQLLVLFVCFLGVMSVKASDTIVVKKDPRLETLTAKQAAMNKRNSMMTSNGQYKGFRVQVLSTRDRTKALNTKAELLARFPGEKTYTVYQSPYFRIRIGNFIKREDADDFRKALASLYPEGAFVVADVIEYTPPEEDEEIME